MLSHGMEGCLPANTTLLAAADTKEGTYSKAQSAADNTRVPQRMVSKCVVATCTPHAHPTHSRLAARSFNLVFVMQQTSQVHQDLAWQQGNIVHIASAGCMLL